MTKMHSQKIAEFDIPKLTGFQMVIYQNRLSIENNTNRLIPYKTGSKNRSLSIVHCLRCKFNLHMLLHLLKSIGNGNMRRSLLFDTFTLSHSHSMQ